MTSTTAFLFRYWHDTFLIRSRRKQLALTKTKFWPRLGYLVDVDQDSTENFSRLYWDSNIFLPTYSIWNRQIKRTHLEENRESLYSHCRSVVSRVIDVNYLFPFVENISFKRGDPKKWIICLTQGRDIKLMNFWRRNSTWYCLGGARMA